MGVDQRAKRLNPLPLYCSTIFRAKNHGARTFFYLEIPPFK